MKLIPYGIADFDRIRREDFYYIDKTMFIPTLEERGCFILLLRPRRMGKSLFTNMLMSYYDLNKREQFEELFGDLWIGRNRTPLANTHLVIKFDFSYIGSDYGNLPKDFKSYCLQHLDFFFKKYKNIFSEEDARIVLSNDNPGQAVENLVHLVHSKGEKIYLFIDEYDNFTNTVLSARGVEAHHNITHGEGFYRDFFKCCKGTFDRIYMTGVTPVTYDDLSSGFGIADIISLAPQFHQIVGVSDSELREMIEYYRSEGRIQRSVDEIVAELKPWCDNYCFAEECFQTEPTMYNTNMVMRYMREVLSIDKAPKVMIDYSARTDYQKLDYLIMSEDIGDREERIETVRQICATGETYGDIVPQFPAGQAGEQKNFKSMLYYFGTLTYAGYNEWGETVLRVPNRTMGELYLGYMLRVAEEGGFSLNSSRMQALNDAVKYAAVKGEWQPLVETMAALYHDYSSIRNAIKGEHDIQGFMRGLLCLNRFFDLWPELELNKGFCDVLLMPQRNDRCLTRHSYIIEFKYMKAGETDIQARIDEACRQLDQYVSEIHLDSLTRGTDCTLLYMVFQGQELVASGIHAAPSWRIRVPAGCARGAKTFQGEDYGGVRE